VDQNRNTMFGILWAALMIASLIGAGVYIKKNTERRRKKKRA
jgi:cytochrome oxidase assembly protein ShyY1